MSVTCRAGEASDVERVAVEIVAPVEQGGRERAILPTDRRDDAGTAVDLVESVILRAGRRAEVARPEKREKRDRDLGEIGRRIDVAVVPGSCLEEPGDIVAAAADLVIELLDQPGKPLADRIGQGRVVDHGAEFLPCRVDIARHGVGAGEFGARRGIVGLYRQHPLQRDDRFAVMASVDCGGREGIIVGGIAGAGGLLAGKLRILRLGVVT